MRIFSLAAIAIVACAHQSANPPEPAAAATAELAAVATGEPVAPAKTEPAAPAKADLRQAAQAFENGDYESAKAEWHRLGPEP